MLRIMLGGLLLMAAAPPPLPLAPSGQWVVEYAEDLCLLYRNYGAAPKPVMIGFRPIPLGDKTDVVVGTVGTTGGASLKGKARLALSPGGTPIEGDYVTRFVPGQNRRVSTISIDQDALKQIAHAAVLTVRLGNDRPIEVSLRNAPAALAALTTCTDDLLTGWEIDPKEREHIAKPAQALQSPATWFTSADYPKNALSASHEGKTVAAITIEADGRVSDCRTVVKSGTPALDASICRILPRRARYEPALDSEHKPIRSHRTLAFEFRIP